MQKRRRKTEESELRYFQLQCEHSLQDIKYGTWWKHYTTAWKTKINVINYDAQNVSAFGSYKKTVES